MPGQCATEREHLLFGAGEQAGLAVAQVGQGREAPVGEGGIEPFAAVCES
jgi:hypothetical protein